MRHPRVVVRVALIAAFAAVAVPALALSRPSSSVSAPDPSMFNMVRVGGVSGSAATTIHLPRLPFPLDAYTDFASPPPSEADEANPFARPALSPTAAPGRTSTPAPAARPVIVNRWHLDADVSWYGPGFYGGQTACGVAFTTTVLGVANRDLPCGTRVTFRNPANGRTITVRVIDRGPYVSGRQWDLSGGLCQWLDHCYTGGLLWRLA